MSRKNPYPSRMRLSYWFDNRMAGGFLPKVRLLLVITIVFVVAMGSIALLANGFDNAGETFTRTLMYTLGKGGALTIGADGVSPLYFMAMLLTILYCMFFSACLIGLINNELRRKVDELGKGQSRVLENEHILILGFNEATMVLVGEFIEASRNLQTNKTVVILGKDDRSAMSDALHRRFGKPRNHPHTRIICRTGSTFSFADLKRCSAETCHSIIVNGSTDFETVKSIMACSHVLASSKQEVKPFIVSVVRGGENIVEATSAAHLVNQENQLEFLSLNETLARIMVHTSRQPGLSHVFTELFNYSGHELYLVKEDPGFPKLYGKSVSEINRQLKTAFAIGKQTADGCIVIDDPRVTHFNKGDALITVQKDNVTMDIANQPVSPGEFAPGVVFTKEAVSALVIGENYLLDSVLLEYGEYLNEESTVHVAIPSTTREARISETTLDTLNTQGVRVQLHSVDASNRNALFDLLDTCQPDCVLVLAGYDADEETDDERTIKILIYLREYRNCTASSYSITSEIRNGANKELASATGPDDFIVGNHMSALLMAQIAQQRDTAKVFEELLSSEGFEVYMKLASWYITPGKPITLMTAVEAVASRGETFIGFRQMLDGVYQPAVINPSRFVSDMQTPRQYTFGENDYFVVLAKEARYE